MFVCDCCFVYYMQCSIKVYGIRNLKQQCNICIVIVSFQALLSFAQLTIFKSTISAQQISFAISEAEWNWSQY